MRVSKHIVPAMPASVGDDLFEYYWNAAPNTNSGGLMNCSRLLTSVAVVATFGVVVTPAFAGQRGGGQARGSSVSRGGSGGGGPRSGSAAPRPSPSRSYGAPASRPSPSRGAYSLPSQGVYPSQSRGAYSFQSRGYSGPRADGYSRIPPRGYRSSGVYVAPRRFYRPYYSFRPRFSLGFGLWVGYPIAYSYPYYYGYPYSGGYWYYSGGVPYYSDYSYYGADPYYGVSTYPNDRDVYGSYYPAPTSSNPVMKTYGNPVVSPSATYPPANYPTTGAPQPGSSGPDPGLGSITAEPGAPSGGVSFEISPSTADVYIDGKYAGRVSDLGPTTQPLALTPGRHHIEIRAAGYQTQAFDADITAGQVLPYQGTMLRER
jgi:hypothetical protein